MLVALGRDEPAGQYGGPRSVHLLLSPRDSHTANELHKQSGQLPSVLARCCSSSVTHKVHLHARLHFEIYRLDSVVELETQCPLDQIAWAVLASRVCQLQTHFNRSFHAACTHRSRQALAGCLMHTFTST